MCPTEFLTAVPRLADSHFDRSSQLDAWSTCPELRADLELRLDRSIDELDGPLVGPLRRVVGAGGKRLRPALTLTIARLSPATELDDALDLAAAVELLHSATLVHDDLIDGSDTRRGVATLNAREGVAAAVVSGDLLIGAAGVLAAGVSADASQVLAQTLIDLCQGEAGEEGLRFAADAELSQIDRVMRLKTGSLLRTACQFGALASGRSLNDQQAVAEFGMHFGVSLQILDDLLDVASSPGLAGKPVGADFFAGTVTLPAVHAMRAHPQLRGLLRPGLADHQRSQALDLLRSAEALRPTVAAAVKHAECALDALSALDVPNGSGVSGVAVERLGGWPMRFLRAQLATKVDPSLRQLIQPAAAA
jgi:heptaprenyl diphosphate synthase